jgi:hypothetical protein
MAKERTVGQAPHLRIIDGGKSDFPSAQDDELEISPDFVDRVMKRLESEPQIVQLGETATIIEFCGPKRLPKLTQVKKEEQKHTRWNIRNFFRKK